MDPSGTTSSSYDSDADAPPGQTRIRRFPLPQGDRWGVGRWFLALGTVGVVGGGIVAAVTGPTDFERGSWVAAYLVLVVGVAQIPLGAGLAWLPTEVTDDASRTTLLLGWNLAAVAVVTGTLISAPVLTSIGGVITAASLVGFVVAVARSRPEFAGWTLLYRALALFVLLSTPVGLLLAWIRNS